MNLSFLSTLAHFDFAGDRTDHRCADCSERSLSSKSLDATLSTCDQDHFAESIRVDLENLRKQ